MTPNFEDSTAHVRQKLAKLSRDAQKSVNGSRPVRLLRLFKNRYSHHESLRDLVDSIVNIIGLGLMCGAVFAISIIQTLNYNKFMGTLLVIAVVAGIGAAAYILYQIFKTTEPLPKPMPPDHESKQKERP